MKRVGATTVLMIGVLAATGCSGSDPRPAAAEHAAGAEAVGPPPTVTASPTVSSLNTASLPLDRYTTTVDEYIELDYASKLLTFDCMQRFGYKLDPGGRLKLKAARDRTNHLGLVDAAAASRAGYHTDPAHAGDYSTRDNGPKLTDEQGLVMFGRGKGKPARKDIPPGGCVAEGYRKVGWSTDDDLWLQNLAMDAVAYAFADKRAATVMADWSACMRESGYRYDRPEQASQDPRWWKAGDDAPASKAEKNTAVADVRCKKKANYLGRMTAILTAYQQQIVEKNLERLESVHDKVQQALKNAATVLSGR